MNGPSVTIQLPQKEVHRSCESAGQPPTRLARQLALAHLVERLVESGKMESYSVAARRLGVAIS